MGFLSELTGSIFLNASPGAGATRLDVSRWRGCVEGLCPGSTPSALAPSRGGSEIKLLKNLRQDFCALVDLFWRHNLTTMRQICIQRIYNREFANVHRVWNQST